MNASDKNIKSVRVGVFESIGAAEGAFKSLNEAGFSTEELSVLCSNEWQQRHFPDAASEVEDPQSATSAAAGGAVGALLSGLGAAAGLATVAGIPVVVAGALGAALTGGVVGSLTGVMVERGFDPEAADYFDQAVSDGKILISVHPQQPDPARLKTAAKLLRDAGAEPISLLEG